MDKARLESLLECVMNASEPDRDIDWHIASVIGHESFPKDVDIWPPFMEGSKADKAVPKFTAFLDAARGLVHDVLPGWWVASGICDVTGHASIGPDYNGPNRERLLREFPVEKYDHGGFDADLAPGSDAHRECYAIIVATLRALISRCEDG